MSCPPNCLAHHSEQGGKNVATSLTVNRYFVKIRSCDEAIQSSGVVHTNIYMYTNINIYIANCSEEKKMSVLYEKPYTFEAIQSSSVVHVPSASHVRPLCVFIHTHAYICIFVNILKRIYLRCSGTYKLK